MHCSVCLWSALHDLLLCITSHAGSFQCFAIKNTTMWCRSMTSVRLAVVLLLLLGIVFNIAHITMQCDKGCTWFYNTIPWPGFHQYYLDSSSLPRFHHLLFLYSDSYCKLCTPIWNTLAEKYKVCACQGFLRGLRGPFKGALHWFCTIQPVKKNCIRSSVALEELCEVCENNPGDAVVMSTGLSLLGLGDYQFTAGKLGAWSLKGMGFYKERRV